MASLNAYALLYLATWHEFAVGFSFVVFLVPVDCVHDRDGWGRLPRRYLHFFVSAEQGF